MDLKAYTGLNIPNVLESEAQKEVYMVNWRQLYLNYGDNVEWQRLKKQVLLCDATREALYAAPGPVKYVKGTRPYLEEKVNEVIKDCKTDRERVLALMVYIRDLYKSRGGFVFYGGTEEEMIKKGENLCECVGRLMVALCEVCGIPGRIVMHVAGGHIVSEVYFEGRWAYIDPRAGMFYLNEKDQFLSIDEVMRDRSCIRSQSDWVKSFISDQWTYDQRENSNYNIHFSQGEIQCFCDYSLMDAPEYNYEWQWCKTVSEDPEFPAVHKRYVELIKEIFG